MLAAKIVLDAAAAQIGARKRVSDRALARDHADVAGPVHEDAVSRQELVDFVQLRNEIVEEFFQLRDETGREIANLPADARIGSGEARASEKLEKVVEFFALRERVKKDG